MKVLSIGEGITPGFAYNLAQSYLKRGMPGRVVAVDLEAARYALPQNMSHVQGDAITFLKSLPDGSVGRVHDHFTTHHIETGLTTFGGAIALTGLVRDAKAGSKFALSAGRKITKVHASRLQNYFSQVKRVLRPGGKLVLVNSIGESRFAKSIENAGLELRSSVPLGYSQLRRLSTIPKEMLGEEGKLYLIIASKRR